MMTDSDGIPVRDAGRLVQQGPYVLASGSTVWSVGNTAFTCPAATDSAPEGVVAEAAMLTA